MNVIGYILEYKDFIHCVTENAIRWHRMSQRNQHSYKKMEELEYKYFILGKNKLFEFTGL